jgi:hypothetical protein
MYLGPNTNSLVNVPIEFFTNDIISVVIPPSLRGGPVWMVASNVVNQFFVGGFGLGTTNYMTDFQQWAGIVAKDSSIHPTTILTNAGNIRAWDAYLFGLDASHTETLREQHGYPSLGTLPYVDRNVFRFGGRANIPYTATSSSNLNTGWTVTNLLVIATTNGWNEYQASNTTPAGFYRIASPSQ